MIKLTRLNGNAVVINAELIEWVETHPDTTISLATGSKIVVKNNVDDVIEKIMAYRRDLAASGKPSAETLLKTYTGIQVLNTSPGYAVQTGDRNNQP